jgi:hypothetical protein
MTQLHNAFDASVRFSDARCKKVLPISTAAYQENLPAHYTKAYHEGKVSFLSVIPKILPQKNKSKSCSRQETKKKKWS